MEQDLLREGIQSAKAGNRAKAQQFLRKALDVNPKSVTALLWLSGIVDSDQEKRQCLEQVLEIDPNNQAALHGLTKLGGQTLSPPVEQAPPPQTVQVLENILQEMRNLSSEIRALRTSSLRPLPSESDESVAKVEKSRLRSALFVDFDNIFIGLETIDRDAAERFATDPARWLKWIEQGMRGSEEEQSHLLPERALLIRRCYLNPRSFHHFRPYFSRSAFSVVDCPPLTSQGKTSSDIHMVMDILDTLQHGTRFDEFIILSGDADFTPVLLELRRHDFRTTVVSIGPAAEAYKAACERVITEDNFIEDALGLVSGQADSEQIPEHATEVSSVAPVVLDSIAEKVYQEASASGEILATDLPRIFKQFPQFTRDRNWLGFFSLRELARALIRRRPDLRLVEGDPWRVSVRASSSGVVENDLKAKIMERVREFVFKADEAVLMAKVAQEVIEDIGAQVTKTRWAGAGTFKNLLQSVEGRGFEILTAPGSPGYLYDPERHARPSIEVPTDELPSLPASIATFVRRVHQVTGTPALLPRQYRLVFEAIADELKEHPYNINATSKAVRDLCIERGDSISRANVSFILRGIYYAGHRFGKDPEENTAINLATVFRKNVLTLINDAQLELTEDEPAMLDEWILGGFDQHLDQLQP